VTRTLAVVGLDRQHRPSLERLGAEHGFRVRGALGKDRVRRAATYDMERLLADANAELGDAAVDGIACYWDFPGSCLTALLAEQRGLPTPGVRAIVTAEHKYWSRRVQQAAAPEDTPSFTAVDVFAGSAATEPPLDYPFWLKPVKSYSSHLSFRIDHPDDLAHAVARLRDGIARLGVPFQQVLDRVEGIPREIAAVGGVAAIAEEIIDGDQCTLEGYVHDDEVHTHGIFDIHRAADGSTFTSYSYPSNLAEGDRERMRAVATDVMQGMGHHDGAFNIEFFRDVAAGRTWILEVNPRISQEHASLMAWVDGASNLQIMAQAALGDPPGLQPRQGTCEAAGKFFVRRGRDAVVTGVPDPARIAELEDRFAPCRIEVDVEVGQRLSEMTDQEPYSYAVGSVYVGARDREALQRRYDEVVDALDLRFDEES
jgi:biotin carboxylase